MPFKQSPVICNNVLATYSLFMKKRWMHVDVIVTKLFQCIARRARRLGLFWLQCGGEIRRHTSDTSK